MSFRILVVSQLPPPHHGSTVMTQRFMGALVHNGVDTKIVQKTFSRKMGEVGKISILKILKIPFLCFRLMYAVRTFKPDICFYFITVGVSSLLVDSFLLWILRRHNVSYVLYFHGKGYKSHENHRYNLIRYIIRKTLSYALGGLVLGKMLKDDVAHCIPVDRLYVLPNSVPDIGYKERSIETASDKVANIIFLSNLVPTKGPMEFLEMAKLVSEKEPSVRFILAGQHTDRNFSKELMEYVEQQSLQDVVEFRGAVFGEAKEKLFQDAHLMVFPTYFEKETFGLVNIEAMQWGLPVISSDKGAIPDIVKDGINGFIVNPHNISQMAERVLRLIRNPDLRHTMGKAGRRLYEENYSLAAYNRNVKKAIKFFIGLNQVRR